MIIFFRSLKLWPLNQLKALDSGERCRSRLRLEHQSITLINRKKIIDLFSEYGLGVQNRTIELLELDTDAFVQIDDGENE
jgi:hypothetical protein